MSAASTDKMKDRGNNNENNITKCKSKNNKEIVSLNSDNATLIKVKSVIPRRK